MESSTNNDPPNATRQDGSVDPTQADATALAPLILMLQTKDSKLEAANAENRRLSECIAVLEAAAKRSEDEQKTTEQRHQAELEKRTQLLDALESELSGLRRDVLTSARRPPPSNKSRTSESAKFGLAKLFSKAGAAYPKIVVPSAPTTDSSQRVFDAAQPMMSSSPMISFRSTSGNVRRHNLSCNRCYLLLFDTLNAVARFSSRQS